MRLISLILCSLLIVPAGSVFAQECVIPVPGDLNGDCRVDFEDLAIVSANWLKDGSLPEKLPVLTVADVGLTGEQARQIAGRLGLDPERVVVQDGAALFVDPKNFQAVPTAPITDPAIVETLLKDTERDGDSQIVFEGFDFGALRKITPPDPQAVIAQTVEALKGAGVELPGGAPEADHTVFEALDVEGQPLLPAVQLDTRINFPAVQDGVPVLGPGAQMSFSFGPDGTPTQLLIARRGVKPGDAVGLVSPTTALQAVQPAAGAFIPDAPVRLVYYAPPLSEGGVKVLIPHYDIGGILYGPEGQQANKLRKLVPAVADPRLVPTVELTVQVTENVVNAKATVGGGQSPYRYRWISSSTDLSRVPEDQSSVEYTAFLREGTNLETITVIVTDENGVQVQASETVTVIGGVKVAVQNAGVLSTGPDFGVERGVSDLCAANQAGFVNRFVAEGVTKRFNWSANSAWERDFKEGSTGLDSLYVDNADIVFYCGHGYGGGFTFETDYDDRYLTYADAAGAWGNRDLEFLSLLSCQVLKETYDSKRWSQRWGPAFDGLHLLCGFQTNAYDWADFGGRFADYVLGREYFGGLVTITLPVRAAWLQAKKEEQPADVEAVVMGVFGPDGCMSGYNDYFWGQGPIGPDIRGSNIRGYWRIVYK